ncbi:MAG: SiaC family regulatory phosphoprotein [Bacteroidales bacterium]|nr:SiaC family regulatory phosphoprotein [Bacteroidales bacterium]
MKTILEPTQKTPGIYIDESSCQLSIAGRLIPENPEVFFKELHTQYASFFDKFTEISIKFDLEYFNTGAARYLYKFFTSIKDASNLSITWVYETDDEDIFESGKEFENLTGLKFDFETK